MNHLSDETINECLDNTLAPDLRAGVEAHLAACPACATRVADLRSLFAELDSLPDMALEIDFVPVVIGQIVKHPAGLPRMVQWLAGLQAVAVILAGMLAWPLVAASLPAGLIPAMPSDLDVFASLTTIFATRFNLINNLRLPSFTIPIIDLPTATLIYSAIGLSLLWLLSNGLLILPRSRRQS